MQITLNEEKRIDKIELEGLSRSRLANLIEEGCVSVNGKTILKPSFKAKAGDEIKINIPEVKEIELKPEKLDIRIIYEDDDLAVVYKPCGMVVHPARASDRHPRFRPALSDKGLIGHRRRKAPRHNSPPRQGHERASDNSQE